MNRHRDPKDIEKEVLEKKLANTDPFKGDRFFGTTIVKATNNHPLMSRPIAVLMISGRIP